MKQHHNYAALIVFKFFSKAAANSSSPSFARKEIIQEAQTRDHGERMLQIVPRNKGVHGWLREAKALGRKVRRNKEIVKQIKPT